MSGISITFALSSVGIIGMIFIKIAELKSGKPSLMSKVSNKTNHIVHGVYFKVRNFLSYFNKRNAILLIRFLIVRTLILVRKVYLIIYNKIMSYPSARKLRDMVNGKGVIRKKGAASFFLQRITDEAQEEHDEMKEKASSETF